MRACRFVLLAFLSVGTGFALHFTDTKPHTAIGDQDDGTVIHLNRVTGLVTADGFLNKAALKRQVKFILAHLQATSIEAAPPTVDSEKRETGTHTTLDKKNDTIHFNQRHHQEERRAGKAVPPPLRLRNAPVSTPREKCK